VSREKRTAIYNYPCRKGGKKNVSLCTGKEKIPERKVPPKRGGEHPPEKTRGGGSRQGTWKGNVAVMRLLQKKGGKDVDTELAK